METIGLIAGGSGHTLTEELQKAGYTVALAGGVAEERGMDIADYTLVCDLRDTDTIIHFLKEKKVNKIILGTGHRFAFELAEKCEEEGLVASVDAAISKLFKDKIKYKQNLVKNNLPTPLFYAAGTINKIDDIINTVGLPCVIKSPVDKSLPQKVNTREELNNALQEVLSKEEIALAEEFITGVDITIPVTANYENIKALFVSYYSKAKEVKLKGFDENRVRYLSPAEEEAAMIIAEHSVRKAGIVGFCRVDMLVDDNNKMQILECNSVTVTGTNSPQAEFSRNFVCAENKRHNINMAALLVENAFTVFEQKQKRVNDVNKTQ